MNSKLFAISFMVMGVALSAQPTSFLAEDIESLGCYLYEDYSFYDLRPLQNIDGDYSATNSLTSWRYVFNFCQYTSNPCGKSDVDTFAYREAVLGTSCFIQTDSDYYPETILSTPADDEQNSGIHVTVTYDGGELCNDAPSSMTYEIYCDPSITGAPQSLSFLNSDECNPIISLTHAAGCPVASANAFFSYLEEHPWLVGTLLLVAGLLMTFVGAKFLPWVVALITGTVAFTLIMVLCSALGWLDYIDPTMVEGEGSLGLTILSFALGIIGGVLVGFLFKVFFFYGFVLLGFALGYLAGTFLYSLTLIWADSLVILYLLQFGLAALGAYLCFAFKDALAIITTSAIGAYATIRGIAEFAGGYPDELLLYQEIQNGTATWELSYLLYLVGMVVLCIIGIFVQSKFHKDAAQDHFKSAD